ncbi:uncharacterized protein LOC106778758 [Vigna radiata var. radiata]|uniref:Uncharacterized protein LOC106778758 n=1 Tax=Vigna radiata var. radiata TaxID=3916 RepID=A0A1S3VV15_VIGRR|nr:uncharacterized protein LOC106778758 [Vigna radiata var. radiata]XP_014522230.1 uncharacterized protein LOC106778758 [Vigna radiata var. radiata]XP_014522232.1 uncharacterized protein LOC106778758 [Vigna radiata var. radiata]
MALLGMGANRQNNGYIPGYHSPRDLVFSAEGSTWTSSNYTGEREDDCHGLGSSPLSSTCHLLGYNKELLKQTILKHEAIFRDQIHELHRIYQKQKELMDEIKRIELHKHTIRLETSSSSSSLYYSQNLHWFTSQSSILKAEGIQLPLASMQEMSRQLHPTPVPAPAPAAVIESSKDTTLSVSAYRKVGKKILDLQLPADEYIDSEGESCENERAIKELALSTYTLNGISKAVYNTVEKPFRTNFNGFSDLNLPFKLEEETGVKSDDFGASIHHKNYTFHDMPRRIRPGSHSFTNDVIQNLERKQDLQACLDPPIQNKGTKHGRLPLGTGSGQNGSDLGSLAIFNDTESQSVSIESISKKLKQVNSSRFHSTNQIVPGLRTDMDSFAGRHNPTNGVWLGPSYASCPCSSHQLVSESDLKSSRISPPVLWKSIASGCNLDCQNCLHSKFCNRSNLLGLPSISTDDPNCCDRGPSSAGHELWKYVKDSEYVETNNNINLNVMPVSSSETKAAEFQSIRITVEYDKFQDSRLPWLKEKPAVPKGNPTGEREASTPIDCSFLNPSKFGCVHSDLELNKVQKSNLCAFDLNGKPQTPKVVQSLSTDHRTEEINKISNVKLPSDGYPDMGEQASVSEYMKNEKKHKHSSGILDLNSCTNEDENMAIDNDLQAPASPENKECSPPRGESDENQPEMLRLAGQEQEVPEAREEQTRIAAEALVSISEALTYDGIQMTNCPSSEPSITSSLHWFAGIISTVVDHPEHEVKEDFNCAIKDLEDFLPADFDYFEFMSLNLSDTKDLYKSSGQNEQEGLYTSSSQPRKCRTNRRRQGNDFQSDILPSLASLSRYEVTEDLQTIGGLVEAARKTPSASGCLRSAGRNVVARGKRKSCGSSSNITDLLLNLKELNIDTEIAIEKMGYISWGKICRKPRGKRFPISKSHLIFSQVHN